MQQCGYLCWLGMRGDWFKIPSPLVLRQEVSIRMHKHLPLTIEVLCKR